MASSGEFTIGSPFTLKDVFRNIGKFVNFCKFDQYFIKVIFSLSFIYMHLSIYLSHYLLNHVYLCL